MYGIIRMVIVLIVLILIPKIKTSKKVKGIVGMVFGVVLSTLLTLVPVENLFMNFSSPEAVYRYVKSTNVDIKTVVPGEKSDMVIAEKDENTYGIMIVPKTEEGWEIGNLLAVKLIYREMYDGFIIDVKKYSETDDYYIAITDLTSKVKNLNDSYDSEFVSICRSTDESQSQIVKYYTSIRNFDEQYWIEINGEKLYLVQNKS